MEENNKMENLICEKCENEVAELVMMTTCDYAMGQGSWCAECAENFEPADFF